MAPGPRVRHEIRSLETGVSLAGQVDRQASFRRSEPAVRHGRASAIMAVWTAPSVTGGYLPLPLQSAALPCASGTWGTVFIPDNSELSGGRRAMDLTGKTALVTGASRGLGRAIAEKLAREDALVAVNYAGNRLAAEAAVARIEAAGSQAFAVQARLGGQAIVPDPRCAGIHHRPRRRNRPSRSSPVPLTACLCLGPCLPPIESVA